MLPAARSPLAPAPGPGVRSWRVLGAFPTALYAAHPDQGVLAVVTADGLALPTAWRLPVASPEIDWGVAVGERIGVDSAVIRLPHSEIRAVRTWRPARVRRVTELVARDCDGASQAWLRERVGRGPGLTPEGDDEVCGALLVAYAVGDPVPGAAARRLLDRTTTLSASLIGAAIDGYAVPGLVTYADAALRGVPTHAMRAAVARIGHTSGAALLRGVDHAIAHLTKERLSA